MNAALLDRFAAARIHLQRARDGENRAARPRCNRPHHDDALAVRIAADRACWVCHRCGWADATSTSGEHQEPARRAPLKLPKADRKEGFDLARQIWIEAVPLDGTLGADYLKGRACLVPRPDGDVRFHPRLFCAKASRTLPALVCRVSTVVGNRGIGVHRIFLDPLGSDKAIAKMRLGGSDEPVCIRLTADDAVTTTLLIAEDVVATITVARATAVVPRRSRAGEFLREGTTQ